MPYDANLILSGQYSGAYVDLDENDAAPTSLTVNSDGNQVVDLGPIGTGALGLIAVHPWKTRFEEKYGRQADLLAECVQLLEQA